MKKKVILARIAELEQKIKEVETNSKNNSLSIQKFEVSLQDESRRVFEIQGKLSHFEERYAMVNYLITTKFLGKIKHKRLVSKFKDELKKSIKDYTSFEDLKTKILDGTIALWDLETYMFVLGEREREQEVVDFCNKEEEK